MGDDLSQVVATTIDAFIRSFNPANQEGYFHWEAELRRVEHLIFDATSHPDRDELLTSIRSERISLSFDRGDFERVVQQSYETLRVAPAEHPSLLTIVIMRARALHSLGLHEQEIEEVLSYARKDEFERGNYLPLLEHLGRRHPGSVPPEGHLLRKLREAISTLRGQGYEPLPDAVTESDIEEVALRVADELHRINREKGEVMLRDEA